MTLEPRMANPVELAIPFFILLVLIEIAVTRWRRIGGYEIRDTAASLAMGLGNLVIGLLAGIGAYYALKLLRTGEAAQVVGGGASGYPWPWSLLDCRQPGAVTGVRWARC